jgi:hypothetical protein
MQLSYKEMKMVAKRNIESLTGPAPRTALPAGKAGYGEDDEDGHVTF